MGSDKKVGRQIMLRKAWENPCAYSGTSARMQFNKRQLCGRGQGVNSSRLRSLYLVVVGRKKGGRMVHEEERLLGQREAEGAVNKSEDPSDGTVLPPPPLPSTSPSSHPPSSSSSFSPLLDFVGGDGGGGLRG
jgi:hypothetical protein